MRRLVPGEQQVKIPQIKNRGLRELSCKWKSLLPRGQHLKIYLGTHFLLSQQISPYRE